jgi:hypothetical protein
MQKMRNFLKLFHFQWLTGHPEALSVAASGLGGRIDPADEGRERSSEARYGRAGRRIHRPYADSPLKLVAIDCATGLRTRSS